VELEKQDVPGTGLEQANSDYGNDPAERWLNGCDSDGCRLSPLDRTDALEKALEKYLNNGEDSWRAQLAAKGPLYKRLTESDMRGINNRLNIIQEDAQRLEELISVR
jgi:hypothetical protein